MQTPTMTIDKDGIIRYSLNGRLHRLDGPAFIYPDGTQSWWLNGKYHRTDGPAIIYVDGTEEWYLNDRKYSFTDYCKQLKLPDEDIIILKLKYNTCIPA